MLLFISLFLTIALTPIESVNFGGEDSTLSIIKIFFVVVFVIWAFSGFPYSKTKILDYYITLFVFFVVSLPFSISIEHSTNRLFLMFLPTILLCAIIGSCVNSKKRLLGLVIAYVIGSIILSVFAYYNRIEILMNAVNEYGERVTALGHDENEMSYLLVLGVTCALHLFDITKSLIVRILLVVSMSTFSFFTIMTASRTGMVSLFAVFTIYMISRLNSVRRAASVAINVIILIVVAGYLITFIPESALTRLTETNELVSSGDMSGRGSIWQNGINAYLDGNIILGAGYDNFMIRYAEYVGSRGRASHNTYLSFLVSGGLIGFVLFTAILVFIFNQCRKIYKISGNLFVFAYYIPLLLTMFTLEITDRRWLYILGVLIYEWRMVLENETNKDSINHDKNERRFTLLSHSR